MTRFVTIDYPTFIDVGYHLLCDEFSMLHQAEGDPRFLAGAHNMLIPDSN